MGSLLKLKIRKMQSEMVLLMSQRIDVVKGLS